MVLRRDQQKGSPPACFTILPDGKSRSGAFLAAIGVEFVIALLILAIPVTPFREIAPATQLSQLVFPLAPAVTPRPRRPQVAFNPPRVERAEAAPLPAPRPRIVRRRLPVAEVPVPTPEFHAPTPVYRAKEPPAPAIHTGVLARSIAPAATQPRMLSKVRSGGFGDPFGVPATGKTRRAMAIAQVGSFDAPVGPGKGTGGGSIARRVTESAGFGNAVTSPGQGEAPRHAGGVHAGVFSNQAAVPTASVPVPHASSPTIQPVEILEKPEPVYTAEARARKIEGNVVLDVVFTANGKVDVSRVLESLGYGLDQAAIAAARRIRFRPERINGKPVDTHARLRIVFRLAY